MPPLRERKDDLEALASHFMKFYAKKFNKSVERIPAKVMAALYNYHWPGNVRELQHLIERAVIISSGPELTFGEWFQPESESLDDDLILDMEEVEYRHIKKILEMTHWRIAGHNGAAELLGLNASTCVPASKNWGLNATLDHFLPCFPQNVL